MLSRSPYLLTTNSLLVSPYSFLCLLLPWYPVTKDAADAAAVAVKDAHVEGVSHPPVMFTTDLALKLDPAYAPISKVRTAVLTSALSFFDLQLYSRLTPLPDFPTASPHASAGAPISQRFHEHPEQFADAFARAWYKLTHRDMGPVSRCLGPLVPPAQLWQDPVPAPDRTAAPLSSADVGVLKAKVLASDLTVAQLVGAAWASAATFRGTDKRGGANGARLRLAPQKDWAVNAGAAAVVAQLETLKGDVAVSTADLIVLAGCAAVEAAAKAALGAETYAVPFRAGRTDATQEETDVASFGVLEPTFDGFRNHLGAGHTRSAEELLVDRAALLTLSAPEMTVLVGGLRVLGANAASAGDKLGVFTDRPGVLSNDFFVNLLAMGNEFRPSEADPTAVFEIRAVGGAGGGEDEEEVKFTGSPVDLIFGSNSQLRAISEVYAMDGSQPKFVADFVAAWAKVMDLDRFDLKK